MYKPKTVIIGMGRMGKTRLDALIREGNFTITGLCDSNADVLNGYSQNIYSDWRECIDSECPDVVFVCTVNAFIPDIVCYALEKGCHVFAEKPPGRTLDDVLKMEKVYRRTTNQILKFGFNHRYHNSVIEAKSLIESGFLGEVLTIRGVYGKAADYSKYEWRNDVSLCGGGILLDQGIHMLDLFRYLVGDFEIVNGFTRNMFWKNSVGEDTAFATLETKNGQIATLNSSAIQWKHKFDIDITLSEGYIALNGLLTSTKSYGEEKITYYKKDLEMKSGKLGNPKEFTLCFDEDNSWDLEVAEFSAAIRDVGKIENGTIDDAVAVMKLIKEIYV